MTSIGADGGDQRCGQQRTENDEYSQLPWSSRITKPVFATGSAEIQRLVRTGSCGSSRLITFLPIFFENVMLYAISYSYTRVPPSRIGAAHESSTQFGPIAATATLRGACGSICTRSGTSITSRPPMRTASRSAARAACAERR